MRIIPASLEEHFGLAEQTFCFAWRITPVRGALLMPTEGFTNHDRDLTSNGLLHKSSAHTLPTAFPFSIGLPNNALEAMLLFDGLALDESDVAAGKYDGARVSLHALNYAGDPDEVLDLFGGFLGKAQFGKEAATFELNPWSTLLNGEMGRVFTEKCPYPRFARGYCANGIDVGGLADGPVISSFTKVAAVTTVYSASHFTITGGALSGLAADWANYGILRFTDGPLDGAEFDVVKQNAASSNTVEIWLNLPAPVRPASGDMVALERGCNRTKADCIARNNLSNFGGFPYMPLREGLTRQREA
jgi:uncharacterized phage protein (TIGR02218 family)